MSYAQKIGIYQHDCKVLLGRYGVFSNYINEFAKTRKEGEHGLDLGTGPSGCNSKFFIHTKLDGCDVEMEVVDSLLDSTLLNQGYYNNTFRFTLGQNKLSYSDNSLDFVACSCVIQHLNSLEELQIGVTDIHRVLKPEGCFYLMFKVGTNDTCFTHYNEYYGEERTFRVFSLHGILDICSFFHVISSEYLLDENHIPYCCIVFQK